MSCERYAKTLAALAAGAPAAPETEGHLAGCGACRAELVALRETLALADAVLREVAAEEPGPDLVTRIRRRVAEDRELQAFSRPLRWVWAAAGIVLLVTASWFVTRIPRADSSAVPTSRSANTGSPAPGPRETARPASRSLASANDVRRAKASVPSVIGRRAPAIAEPGTAEPLVLVPAGESKALFEFAARLQQRTVAPDSLLVADPLRELPPIEPIRIEPLEIAPLPEAGKS